MLNFKGLYLDSPSELCPNGALIGDSRNFRTIGGSVVQKAGNYLMQITALFGIPLLFYKYRNVAGDTILIAMTSTDAYWWNSGSDKYELLTPIYNTGTVQTSGAPPDTNRTVTGVGTLWDTNGIKGSDGGYSDYIAFSDDGSPPDVDTVSTWYEIKKLDTGTPETVLELNEDGPETGAAEITQVICPANTSGSLNGKYWLLKSAGDATSYYVWYQTDGVGADPAPGGTGILVDLPAGDSDGDAVAAATFPPIDALGDFSAYRQSGATVIVTNAAKGLATDAVDVDTGATITTLTQGYIAGYAIRKTFKAGLTNRWVCCLAYDGTAEENWLIATNGVDVVQVWKGDTSTPGVFEILSADAPFAKCCHFNAGRLLLGNLKDGSTNYPYMVGWASVATPSNWATYGSQEIYDTEGEIMFLAPFGDYVMVGKKDAIAIMRATGINTAPYTVNYIVRGEGSAFRTYAVFPNGMIGFITNNDIVHFDGTPNLKSLAGYATQTEDGLFAGSKMKKAFFDDINLDCADMVHSVWDTRLGEWRIYVPSRDDTLCPNQAWVYQYFSNEWAFDLHKTHSPGDPLGIGFKDNYIAGGGCYRKIDHKTWDEMGLEWAEYTEYWDGYSIGAKYAMPLSGNYDGKVYIEREGLKREKMSIADGEPAEGTGSNIQGVVEYKNLRPNDEVGRNRLKELEIEYTDTEDVNDAVMVEIAVDGAETFTTLGQTINDDGDGGRKAKSAFFNHEGRVVRPKFMGRAFNIIGFKAIFAKGSRR